MNYQIENSISMHQPHFLPWLPYMARIACSEKFIVLDNVQYRKDYFENRTVIKNNENKIEWLTIPVSFSLGNIISEVSIARYNALRKSKMKLFHYYCHSQYFELVWPKLSDIFDRTYTHIMCLNIDLLNVILNILNIDIPTIVYSSTLYSGKDRTERIIKVCQKQKSYIFLNGWGKSNVIHNLKIIEKNNIRFVRLNKERIFKEINNDYFEGGLSIIDLLFRYGIKEIQDVIYFFFDIYREEIQKEK